MKRVKIVIFVLLAVGAVGLIWYWRDGQIKKQEQTVVIVADVHNDIESLRKVGEGEGDLVIIAGDLTNGGTKKELTAIKKVLDDSGKKYYVIPGNHDWWNQKLNARAWEEIFGVKYQSIYVGAHGNAPLLKILLIDNGYWQGLGEEQWQWLRGEAGECVRVKCLVVMHKPLNHLVSDHVMETEAKELLKLLVDNGVKEYFAGHLHYADSYEIGGLRTNLVGAVTRARSGKPEYTRIKITGKGVEKEVIPIEL